jgi:hypothetical protein
MVYSIFLSNHWLEDRVVVLTKSTQVPFALLRKSPKIALQKISRAEKEITQKHQ